MKTPKGTSVPQHVPTGVRPGLLARVPRRFRSKTSSVCNSTDDSLGSLPSMHSLHAPLRPPRASKAVFRLSLVQWQGHCVDDTREPNLIMIYERRPSVERRHPRRRSICCSWAAHASRRQPSHTHWGVVLVDARRVSKVACEVEVPTLGDISRPTRNELA